MGRVDRLNKVLQAPFSLHPTILAHIDTEIENARAGKPARVMAKMNSLIEPQVIQALYRASQAGVAIDLIVRGICSLRPGIKGVSDNIRVRSLVGRFLEHTRIFYFENHGAESESNPRIYLSSADWMGRNFFSRVEVCFPIEDEQIRQTILEEGLDLYLADNASAWELKPDGSYQRASADEERVCAQERLLELLAR